MRSIQRLSLFTFLLTAIACGGDDGPALMAGTGNHNNTVDERDGGDVDASNGGAGKGGSGGKGSVKPVGDAGDMTSPLAPVIKFLAPNAADDPNSDTLITAATTKVECQVTRSLLDEAQPVDQSTVRIEAHYVADPDQPDKITVIKGAVNAGQDSTFSAEFNLSDVANGAIEFLCAASDVGKPAIEGSDTLSTLLDLGPEVEIITPEDGSSHALESPVTLKFRVTASPAGKGDKETKPMHIKLVVSGEAMDFKEDKKDPGTYTTSIDFGDTTLFPMAPATAQIVVTADSSRTPDAPTRRAVSNIALDSEPPKITVVSPKIGSIVRGEVLFTVKITDPAGVNPDSVVANINSNMHVLNHWTIKGDVYSERFDTRAFDQSITQLSIVIKAEDRLGNKAKTGTEISHILYQDNVPPRISLNPPNVRELKTVSKKSVCSTAFDPVGEDATSDNDIKPESSLYRAMIIDTGTFSDGANDLHVASVDPKTTVLFAQGDPSVPLLIDTNDDDTCDEINSDVHDGSKDVSPMQRQLKPLTPRGRSFFSQDETFPEPGSAGCTAGTDTVATAPELLCPAPGTLMTRVVGLRGAQPEPVIYASGENLNAGLVACEGESWELTSLGEGWICVAARAEDKLGNIGISRPMPVCLDFDIGDGIPTCDMEHPPSCTDGCTPPAEFRDDLFFSP